MNSKANINIRSLVLSSLFISIVFVSTYVLRFRLPISINGGLIHLGNTALFIIAIMFGKNYGMIAGSFGMALFDLFSEWAIWAPGTFIVRGVMGYLVGYISNNRNNKGENLKWNIVAMIISSIWMIIGYYIYEVILYHNWFYPLTSIPGNITQLLIGAIFTLIIIPKLNKIKSTTLLNKGAK